METRRQIGETLQDSQPQEGSTGTVSEQAKQVAQLLKAMGNILKARMKYLAEAGGPTNIPQKPITFEEKEKQAIDDQRVPGQTREEWLRDSQLTAVKLGRALGVSVLRAARLLRQVGAGPLFNRPLNLTEKTKKLLLQHNLPTDPEELKKLIEQNQWRPADLVRILDLPRKKRAKVYYLYLRLGIDHSSFETKKPRPARSHLTPEQKAAGARKKLENIWGPIYLEIIKEKIFQGVLLKQIAQEGRISYGRLKRWLEATGEIEALRPIQIIKWAAEKYPQIKPKLSDRQLFVLNLIKEGKATIEGIQEAYLTQYRRNKVGKTRIYQIIRTIWRKYQRAIERSKEAPRRIDFSGLSVRARNALLRGGIDTLDKLKQLTLKELRQIRGIGPKTLQEIQTWLKDKGCEPVKSKQKEHEKKRIQSLSQQTEFDKQAFDQWQKFLRGQFDWASLNVRPRLLKILGRLNISIQDIVSMSDDELIAKGLKKSQIEELRRKLFESNITSIKSDEWGELRLVAGTRVLNHLIRQQKQISLTDLLTYNDKQLRNLGLSQWLIERIKSNLIKLKEEISSRAQEIEDWQQQKQLRTILPRRLV